MKSYKFFVSKLTSSAYNSVEKRTKNNVSKFVEDMIFLFANKIKTKDSTILFSFYRKNSINKLTNPKSLRFLLCMDKNT